MKFHHFFILFVVLVFLIFPPIFVNQTDFFTNDFSIQLSDNEYFVLGDNRAESLDSRSTEIGCIDERYIVGKVLFRLFPLGEGKVE